MKKALYSISALLLAFFPTGCTDTTEVAPDKNPEAAYIEVSSQKLIFDADGGCASVIVATNLADWKIRNEGDWYTVEQKQDNIVEINAGINARPEVLTGTVTITGERDGDKFSAVIDLTQRTDRSADLSAEGTSNCYLVHTNSSYKFDASVKGNGRSDGDGKSTYLSTYGIGIEGVAYADLLWEARNDGDKTMSREIIDGAPVYRDGYVAFTTGRSQGNAVIAVKDVNGDILWSWHIWVCDDEITFHPHINASGNTIAEIMDRNLGALNNEPMDIDNRGMFYQWGRKDPFLPARAPYYDDVDGGNIPAYNLTNYEVGNGSGSWIYHETCQPITAPPGNIPNTILHPMTSLQPYYNDVYDWYCASETVDVTHAGLWGPEKTIYDPCPVGYKVPGNNMWGIPSGNTQLRNGGPVEDYDENGKSEKWDWNVCKDGGRTWKYTGDYYPMAGNLYYTSIHQTTHNYAGGEGFYWTCHETPVETEGDSYRQDFNPYWALYQTGAHVYSAQIRCIRE